jgi:hypothetical protein
VKKRIPPWIWFFAVLLTLGVIAGGIEVWYNLSQQLTPEAVRAAEELWSRSTPPAYNFQYTLHRQDRQPIRYQARVRDRQVIAVWADDHELEPMLYALHDLPPLFDAVNVWLAENPAHHEGTVDYSASMSEPVVFRVSVSEGATTVKRNGVGVPSRLAVNYSPTAQLSALERQAEIDRQPGSGRVFQVATFDRQRGFVLRYIRSVSATRERVEIKAMVFD